MSCENCLHWKEPGLGPYGTCKPPEGLLPFWARTHQEDMQTRTLRTEGDPCPAFLRKGSA